MVYRLYDLLLLIAAVILIPLYLLRGYRYGKSRRGIRERLGYYSPEQLNCFQGKDIIWVHAVSVGETRAAAPLLKELKSQYPDHVLLVSNVTETGHAMALENKEIDCCLFFPFDFSWTVRKVLQTLQPKIVVIVETEIWPNFVRQAKKMEVPVVLVNGRISDRSYPRYRFFRSLLRTVLDGFSAFCMQSQIDAERINQLGADSSLVTNTGNLKFDHELRDLSPEQLDILRQRYRLPEGVQVIVAGSTHAGEEEQLISVFSSMLSEGRKLILVLIPRHPERSRDVQSLLENSGLRCHLRSKLEVEGVLIESGEVLLVDTLGEVLDLYALSELVFVGGSLVPIGGHNLLEASLLEKTVLFGPNVQNFREISAKLIRAGAGVKVLDNTQLKQQVSKLLDDPVRCRAMGQAGRTLIAENAGATERTMQRINRCVKY